MHPLNKIAKEFQPQVHFICRDKMVVISMKHIVGVIKRTRELPNRNWGYNHNSWRCVDPSKRLI